MFPAAQSASGSRLKLLFPMPAPEFLRKTLQLAFDTAAICNHENRMFQLVFNQAMTNVFGFLSFHVLVTWTPYYTCDQGFLFL